MWRTKKDTQHEPHGVSSTKSLTYPLLRVVVGISRRTGRVTVQASRGFDRASLPACLLTAHLKAGRKWSRRRRDHPSVSFPTMINSEQNRRGAGRKGRARPIYVRAC